MTVNLSQLRAFEAVAREGGFTRAARALRVTQPTISGQVRELEETYGVQLFERRGRSVELTAAGQRLHELSRRLFLLAAEAHELLSAESGAIRGRLRVGADAPFHLLPLLGRFSCRHPDVELQVSFGNSREVREAVLDQRCDVAVLPEVAPDPRLRVVHLCDEQVVLVVRRDHPWAAAGAVDVVELAGAALVFREEGSTTRAIFERAAADAGVEVHAALEIGSREAMREAVAAGLGVGMIFAGELGDDPRLAPVEVRGAALDVGEALVCLERRAGLPIIRALIEAR